MVLHRPVELARVTGHVPLDRSTCPVCALSRMWITSDWPVTRDQPHRSGARSFFEGEAPFPESCASPSGSFRSQMFFSASRQTKPTWLACSVPICPTQTTRTSCFSLEILLTRNTRSPACTLVASETSVPAEFTTIVEVSSRNAARETGESPEFTIIVEASSWNAPGASRHPRTCTGTCNGWRSVALRGLACAGGVGGFGRGSSPTVAYLLCAAR